MSQGEPFYPVGYRLPYGVLEPARRKAMEAEAAQTPDLGERLARLESQITIIAQVLEELTRPKLTPARQMALAEVLAESSAEEAKRDADLFAPRSKQWDKSAGLEIDDLDIPFPVHPKDDDLGPY